MPKWKDFINPINVIVTYVNPVAGAVLQVAEKIFIKQKERIMKSLDGKKTYIGIAITSTAFIAQFLGYDVSVEDQEGLKEAIIAIVGAVGLLTATYGRVKATKK